MVWEQRVVVIVMTNTQIHKYTNTIYYDSIRQFTNAILDGVGAAGCGDSDDHPNCGKRENKMWPILARA